MAIPPIYPDTAGATWTMATAVVGLLALAAAVWYAHTTAQMFRRDHRPMVRVVWSRRPKAILLKNMGRGTAFGAVLSNTSGRRVSGKPVDAVEPLGAGAQESERIGRVPHALVEQPLQGQTYWLHYQDITGRWHRTVATLEAGRYVVQFRVLRWGTRFRVPKDVFSGRLIRR